jgi:Fe-S cluster biogenesis protein NfuA
MREQIGAVLAKVRPTLRADGGDIELIDVKDGVVQVCLTGACQGCPMSEMTLKQGVEKALKEALPEIKAVVPVNKHAAAGC